MSGNSIRGFPTGTFSHGIFIGDVAATADVTIVSEDATTTVDEDVQTTTQPAVAAVTIENQTSNGTTVVVQSVTLPEGGFVVVHDVRGMMGGGRAGERGRDQPRHDVYGVSEFLEPGTHENVTVELDDPLNDSQRVVAVAHRDPNGNQSFDFLRSNRTADRPYMQQGSNRPVHDFAFVTVEQTNQTETTTAEETSLTSIESGSQTADIQVRIDLQTGEVKVA
ncbi:DUF7282 domain-containing protein [Halorussus salinisoli]|uniref:DUF7282 domain-containing protein n=1 Tax=Halorussus salinisoli TaxID=2558242 RepID=UPI0010C189F7|nr:hypothetical protein [Halorussus salinisoli]